MKLRFAAALASAVLFTSIAHADGVAPVQYAPARPLEGLATAAKFVLGASYVASIAAVLGTTSCNGGLLDEGGIRCHSYSGWLFLPVLGSTIAIADNATKPTMNGEMAFYAVTTGVNVLALTTLIVGLTYRTATRPSEKTARWAPRFDAGTHGASVGVVGAF